MILLMTTLLKYDIYLSVLNNHQIRHTVLIFLTDSTELSLSKLVTRIRHKRLLNISEALKNDA
jgi:hypothetical protein